MQHYPQPQTVIDHTCLLGEGPVWDASEGRIIWVDILQGHIHQYYPETGRHRTFSAGEMVGAVALRRGGGLVAAMQSGFAFVDPERESVEPVADPEAHLGGNRFNDGKCDPQGRFWAGTMSLHDAPAAGALYTLHHDRRVTRQIGDVSISNGLAWSGDGRTFYYIDTPTREVAAYDFDGGAAAICNRRVIIEIPEDFGDPDGMTIDREGMLWIAHWDGWQVTRWDPARGILLGSIRLPVARVTSCTFGGTRMQDLYITTARTGLSSDRLATQPLAGALFVVRDCGHTGLRPYEYAG